MRTVLARSLRTLLPKKIRLSPDMPLSLILRAVGQQDNIVRLATMQNIQFKPNELVSLDRPKTNSRIFAHTRWDAIPVAAAILHCAYFFGMFYLFPRVPLWVMLILGFIYSVSISWNLNGISPNCIHNPYFRSPLLNRVSRLLESITVGFSQIFYECIHMQHH